MGVLLVSVRGGVSVDDVLFVEEGSDFFGVFEYIVLVKGD